jgi:catechol 2,3-dioxygenase-like lactoylglutathione lyase family enzyme
MSASLRHVGIVVTKVEDWVEFFTSTLGFQIWIDQIEKGKFISELLGIPNVEVRTIKLRDAKGGVIELLHFLSPESNQDEYWPQEPNSRGITHIAIEVGSINDVLEKLRVADLFPIGSPQVSENRGAIVCYLRGPEQVLVELVEIIA